jgi:hypothetical protein
MGARGAEEQNQSDVVIRADAYMAEIEKGRNPDALAGLRSGSAMLRQDPLEERLVDALSGGTEFTVR